MTVIIKADVNASGTTLGKIADALYTDAVAIYSVRNVVSTRNAPVLHARRGSDGVERDFKESELYDGTLQSFAGGSDVTATLYNQKGGANLETAGIDRQPKIVSAGNIVLSGGKVALLHDGANDYLAAVVNVPQPFTVFASGASPSQSYGYIFECRDVATPNGANGQSVALLSSLAGQGEDFYTGKDLKGGSDLAANTPFSYAAAANNGNGHLWNNRGGKYTGQTGTYGIGTIITGASQLFSTFTNVKLQEIIVFATTLPENFEAEILKRAKAYFGA